MAFLRKFKKKKGFTLVELMIVVVILGILAVIAIPTFQKFMIRAKEGEAPVNIAAIARGARTYFYANDQKYFPYRTSTYYYMPSTYPSSWCSSYGHNKYSANPSQWESEPWRSLRFNISSDHYYQYRWYASSGGKSSLYRINAYADMDCDGSYQYFYVSGFVDSASGEVRRSSMTQVNRGE